MKPKASMQLVSFVTFLTLSFPAQAEQLKSLGRGDQSFSAYYNEIQNARESIDIATYEMEPCQSIPKVLLQALAQKAKAGVKVRFVVEIWELTEPVKSNLPAYFANITKGKMEIRYYGSQMLFEGDRTRSHQKMFIVDGKSGSGSQIVGGRNWTDSYFGINAKMNYVDQDLLVHGASVGVTEQAFEKLWSESSAAGSGDGAAWGASCFAMSARDKSVAAFAKANAVSILGQIPERSCPQVSYAVDDPDFMMEPFGDSRTGETLSAGRLERKHATALWLDFLNGVNKSFVGANQYYMPWARLKTALDSLRDDKKQVEILTNATGDIDNANQNADFTCYIQSLAFATSNGSQSVKLLTSKGAMRTPWQLSVPSAPWRIHAKTGVRDGADVLVSSWNFDPRSYGTNLEDGILISGCPDLAADVEKEYDVLRAAYEQDKTCTACQHDFVKSYMTANPFCGGVPSFY